MSISLPKRTEKKNRRTTAYLAVIDWVVNRNVPFERYGHGHKNGSGHRDWQERVEQVGEKDDVDRRGEPEALAERLQDAGHEVARVHADEGDEQEVERVAHVLPETRKIEMLSSKNDDDDDDMGIRIQKLLYRIMRGWGKTWRWCSIWSKTFADQPRKLLVVIPPEVKLQKLTTGSYAPLKETFFEHNFCCCDLPSTERLNTRYCHWPSILFLAHFSEYYGPSHVRDKSIILAQIHVWRTLCSMPLVHAAFNDEWHQSHHESTQPDSNHMVEK